VDKSKVWAEKESTLPNTFVDFKEIKERVSIEAVLGHYNIKLRRVNQQSMRGNCPLPMHSSEKSKESFIIQTGKNIWTCQSSSCVAGRSGKKGGNVLDFVALMENCSIRDAALKLRDWFLVTKGNPESQKGSLPTSAPSSKTDDEGENKPLTFSLQGIDHTHPYLRHRGVDEKTARDFGIGFFPGKGSMSGRVVIPIHNERGELIAYAGRAIDDAEPKYKLPAGFKKSAVLFNMHHVKAGGLVIVVEGFFDCVKVDQAGFDVIALMGSSLSAHQEELLCPFSDIIILLDGDDAGREAAKEIAARLAPSHWVRVISLDDGVQPDQLSSKEIWNLLDPVFEL
jgi:DNA primase